MSASPFAHLFAPRDAPIRIGDPSVKDVRIGSYLLGDFDTAIGVLLARVTALEAAAKAAKKSNE